MTVNSQKYAGTLHAYSKDTGKSLPEAELRLARNALYNNRKNVIRLTPKADIGDIKKKLEVDGISLKIVQRYKRKKGKTVSVDSGGRRKKNYRPRPGKAAFKANIESAWKFTARRRRANGYIAAGFVFCAVDLRLPIRAKKPTGRSRASNSYGKRPTVNRPVLVMFNAVSGSGDIAEKPMMTAIDASLDDQLAFLAKRQQEAWGK